MLASQLALWVAVVHLYRSRPAQPAAAPAPPDPALLAELEDEAAAAELPQHAFAALLENASAPEAGFGRELRALAERLELAARRLDGDLTAKVEQVQALMSELEAAAERARRELQRAERPRAAREEAIHPHPSPALVPRPSPCGPISASQGEAAPLATLPGRDGRLAPPPKASANVPVPTPASRLAWRSPPARSRPAVALPVKRPGPASGPGSYPPALSSPQGSEARRRTPDPEVETLARSGLDRRAIAQTTRRQQQEVDLLLQLRGRKEESPR